MHLAGLRPSTHQRQRAVGAGDQQHSQHATQHSGQAEGLLRASEGRTGGSEEAATAQHSRTCAHRSSTTRTKEQHNPACKCTDAHECGWASRLRCRHAPAAATPERHYLSTCLQRDLARPLLVPRGQRGRHHGCGGGCQKVEHHKSQGEQRGVDAQRRQRVGARLHRRQQQHQW